jgi:hypothetical protein
MWKICKWEEHVVRMLETEDCLFAFLALQLIVVAFSQPGSGL